MQDDAQKPFRQNDILDPARANACLRALGRFADIETGVYLPPFFHQLYFWDAQPPTNLGRDGHPKLGGIIPDMGLPRRMWAGGQLEFLAPLRAGLPATKTTTVHKALHKKGRTGPLGFVTLCHEIAQNGIIAVREYQDLVYREDPTPDSPKLTSAAARTDEVSSVTHSFDSTLLFRYSALTFNGHRIHYDLDYARDVEGYTGLVVHGPLLAQLLMLFAQEYLDQLSHFSFRATAPLMHFEPATFCWGGDGTLWVRGPDGRRCMTATAS
ncbi:FAS1-like dehydratase domain-containing protein [Shimia abyssi]|uniref:3-methylfumaryl-CoA hydratase n=1 Tax=Shimia abyssi TaxID=1662395 RepID=A0A2P8F9B7_9RHOB|nr:MaoC family dehydratase N-terminal domain-containing protein [Shimia abyssi]PSL18314.1 3-methylfumaryl-CoA hydratase [Shimia abyssi]